MPKRLANETYQRIHIGALAWIVGLFIRCHPF